MGYNILVVDDSPIIRTMLKRSLEMAGIDIGELHEASNGVEGLEKLASEWIDIVLTDLHMPVMGGAEMIGRIYEDSITKDTTVVVVSSDRNQELIGELKELGVKGYLKKPFRPEEIRDLINELM